MEQDFYRGRLEEMHGLEVLIPETGDREVVHRVIYEELVLGEIRDASREQYKGIIEKLTAAGAQGVILGCTEIGLLVNQEDCRIPLFDTTSIHAEAAVELALAG
jgi:aspartate racemase